MQHISERADISFFVVVELAVACTHVNRLFSLTRPRAELALTLRLLQLLDVLNLGAAAAKSRDTTAVWVHLRAFLLDQRLESGDVPSFLDF